MGRYRVGERMDSRSSARTSMRSREINRAKTSVKPIVSRMNTAAASKIGILNGGSPKSTATIPRRCGGHNIPFAYESEVSDLWLTYLAPKWGYGGAKSDHLFDGPRYRSLPGHTQRSSADQGRKLRLACHSPHQSREIRPLQRFSSQPLSFGRGRLIKEPLEQFAQLVNVTPRLKSSFPKNCLP